MDFAFILFAFFCGLALKYVGLPPLIGFLGAGFLLNFLEFTPDDGLFKLADIGITLMLFTIGLKLNIRDLSKREVWLGSSMHMIVWVVLITLVFFGVSLTGIGYFGALDLQTCALLAFALSFSSTVCVVKILEESGEMKTRHGKLAIGVLVMQDIFAVLFMVIATGKVPSLWALGLLILPFLKPLWSKLLNVAGHGEMLPLMGFFLALGGYELFTLVGIKGDLGALIVGMLIAPHEKSSELAKSLLSFKDIFLVGFFLTIGFTALPNMEMLMTALAICALLPLNFVLFFFLFTKLRLRARTAYLSSLVLNNFSEFGLIVAAMLVSMSLLAKEWLVVLAIVVSISFLITSIAYRTSHRQYTRLKTKLKYYENPNRLPNDVYVQPQDAEVLVLGLGRVGKGAYTALRNELGDKVWGMDADPIRINRLKRKGMQVIVGDGEDIDFWENVELNDIRLVLLALPSVEDMRNIANQLRNANYQGQIASIARYEDEIEPLLEAGSDKVFNFFTEAGTGFAEESLAMLNNQRNLQHSLF
ncbi:cation:proton antiporter [Aestuariibacter sp. AA17]|uniref:Cation:proton antiporter n=1 Tax=Fluctibacter corallii TaxID=2984329 RepID=A0ABT3A698_9ALTE|nr:cation:proton antiporter family protein [Aestuariibacter sp. AA17]MCV2884202.1 cation:proton antiporter [Aestuariibacter sp. AA17]